MQLVQFKAVEQTMQFGIAHGKQEEPSKKNPIIQKEQFVEVPLHDLQGYVHYLQMNEPSIDVK